MKVTSWIIMLGIWNAVVIAGILLMLIGVVRLAVRNKAGVWKDGGANLLAGFIVIGVLICLMAWRWDWQIRLVMEKVTNGVSSTSLSLWPNVGVYGCAAGFVLMLSGAVQLAVRNKTGVWKDGGAKLLVGFIVAGVFIGLYVWAMLTKFGPPAG